MQGFNNYNPYGNYGNTNGIRGGVNPGVVGNMSNGVNNAGWNAAGFNAGGGYQPNGFNPMPPQADNRVFVTGRAGADAYQLPPGVNMQILWDDSVDRFYVKGYDENGRPRVIADNDFQTHVEPEVATPDIDMSRYVTKDDINAMITEAINNAVKEAVKKTKAPNLSNYVTQEVFDATLAGLCVGSGGRVVRADESDA